MIETMLQQCQDDIDRIARFPIGDPIYREERQYYLDKIKTVFAKVDALLRVIQHS